MFVVMKVCETSCFILLVFEVCFSMLNDNCLNCLGYVVKAVYCSKVCVQ